MRPLTVRISLALVALLLSLFADTATACTCLPIPSPYRAYREATAVFIGRAVSSRDVSSEETFNDRRYTVDERYFHFAVEESLKGARDSELDISVGRVDSSCYQGFSLGETYLVYAYSDGSSNVLYSGACTRTKDIRYARDDIHYLRALMAGRPEPRIYGSVSRTDVDFQRPNSRLSTPLSGVRVVVEGGGRRFEAITDREGLYQLNNAPDGRYTVRPLLPERYMSYFPEREEIVLDSRAEPHPYAIEARGPSGYAEFTIGWNNRISGRVLDAEGNPVRRARVSLILAGRAPNEMFSVYEAAHDFHDNGRYEIRGITPGRYVISVSIRAPFISELDSPRTYFPSARDLERAQVIVLGESDDLTGYDVRLLPGQVVRQLEGVLTWPDGSPVTNGWLTLSNSQNSEDGAANYEGDRAGAQGRFSLQAFVGAEYWLHASVSTWGLGFGEPPINLWDRGTQLLYSQPVRIRVARVNEPLRIVIPLPNGVTTPVKGTSR